MASMTRYLITKEATLLKAQQIIDQNTKAGQAALLRYYEDISDYALATDQLNYFEGISAIDDVRNYSPMTDWISGMIPPRTPLFEVPKASHDVEAIKKELASYYQEIQSA